MTNTLHPVNFGVRHLFIEFSDWLVQTQTLMNRSTLVITMVSSNLSDLMGGTRPRGPHLCDTPNNEADPCEGSHLLDTSDATDSDQGTSDTP